MRAVAQRLDGEEALAHLLKARAEGVFVVPRGAGLVRVFDVGVAGPEGLQVLELGAEVDEDFPQGRVPCRGLVFGFPHGAEVVVPVHGVVEALRELGEGGVDDFIGDDEDESVDEVLDVAGWGAGLVGGGFGVHGQAVAGAELFPDVFGKDEAAFGAVDEVAEKHGEVLGLGVADWHVLVAQ